MPLLLLLVLLPLPSMAPPDTYLERAQALYAQKDAEGLRTLLRQAPTREADLYGRYRLYPLTDDADLLDDLPSSLPADASAREQALLAGLWGFRTSEAGFPAVITYGRRSAALLDQATDLDSDDPLVLLIEGQSLLFRPRIAGGSATEALERFERLHDAAEAEPDQGVSVVEADLWRWLALRKLDRTQEAQRLHDALAQQDLAPLYREFLKGDREL